MFNRASGSYRNAQKAEPSTNENLSRPKVGGGEYGRPVAGSMTEARGQKANIHVYKEMLELCHEIYSGGCTYDDETPELKVIPFGELFNIYTHINNKLVGLLLRARKYKIIDFEGEMLFQRRDDDEPIFMLKTIGEIEDIMKETIGEVKKNVHSNPQPTNVLLK